MFYIRDKSNRGDMKKSRRIINVMMYELSDGVGEVFTLRANENERSGVSNKQTNKEEKH